jgi:hypothetical protein
MFIVDTDVIDAHMENLMESLHSPQVSHNHLNKSTDLFTITWTTLSELPTSIHNTMNNIFISFRKLTSKEKIFKGAIKTISGVLSKIKVAHYQVQIGGSVKVLIDIALILRVALFLLYLREKLLGSLIYSLSRLDCTL